jgi:hypothetical protein
LAGQTQRRATVVTTSPLPRVSLSLPLIAATARTFPELFTLPFLPCQCQARDKRQQPLQRSRRGGGPPGAPSLSSHPRPRPTPPHPQVPTPLTTPPVHHRSLTPEAGTKHGVAAPRARAGSDEPRSTSTALYTAGLLGFLLPIPCAVRCRLLRLRLLGNYSVGRHPPQQPFSSCFPLVRGRRPGRLSEG